MKWGAGLKEWIRTAYGITSSGIALLAALLALFAAVRNNLHLFITIIIGAILGVAFILCLYIVFGKRTRAAIPFPDSQSSTEKQIRYVALLLLTCILITIISLLIYAPARSFAVAALRGTATPTLTASPTVPPTPSITPDPAFANIESGDLTLELPVVSLVGSSEIVRLIIKSDSTLNELPRVAVEELSISVPVEESLDSPTPHPQESRFHDRIHIYNVMVAELQGDDSIRIIPEGEQSLAVSPYLPAVWEWIVMPLGAGTARLMLTIYTPIEDPTVIGKMNPFILKRIPIVLNVSDPSANIIRETSDSSSGIPLLMIALFIAILSILMIRYLSTPVQIGGGSVILSLVTSEHSKDRVEFPITTRGQTYLKDVGVLHKYGISKIIFRYDYRDYYDYDHLDEWPHFMHIAVKHASYGNIVEEAEVVVGEKWYSAINPDLFLEIDI